MRFKTDENLPTDLAQLIVKHGHDALSVTDQGLGGASDPHLAAICRSEGRALVTLDLGFADIRAYPPQEYPGLIVLRLPLSDKRTIIRAGRRLLRFLETETPAHRLWIVDQRRIRVRE